MNSLSVAVADGVATLSIQRPQTSNAIDISIIRAMHLALDQLQKGDSGARAVVITGSNDVFCSGLDLHSIDLKTQQARQRAHFEMRRFMDPLILRLSGFRFPIVAAVNGAAVGAGLNLALAADLRIVADDARLLSGFLKIGAHPGGGHLHLLDRVASRDTIAAMAIFGEEVSGTEAVRLGLAWKALPADQVEAEAMAMAARLADQPDLARAVTRTLRVEVPGAVSWDAAMQIERAPQLRSFFQRSRRAGGA